MHAGDARLRVEPMRFKVVDLGFGERGLKFSADGQWCLGRAAGLLFEQGALWKIMLAQEQAWVP